MKTNKIISAVLAGAMLFSSAYSLAFAEGDEVVYTYTNEDGETVNITQSQLDAEHWNKDALGDEIPVTYTNFPMSIEKFVDDLGGLSMDMCYMKNIQAYDNVNLKVETLSDGNVVYNSEITQNSFYSPELSLDTAYVVTLTETEDNTENEYKRIVQTGVFDAQMPEYVTNGESDNNILIADTAAIASAKTVTESGEVIFDNRTPVYNKIPANEFSAYCQTLASGHLYRVFATEDGETFAGFINGNNPGSIIDYGITVSDYEVLNTPSVMSTPTQITITEVQNKAVDLGFGDYSFGLSEDSFAAFNLNLSDYLLAHINDEENEKYTVWTKIRSDVSLGVYAWVKVNDVMRSISVTPEDGNTTRVFGLNLKQQLLNVQPTDIVDIYVAVYFPTATQGFATITESMNVSGLTDDAPNSFYDVVDNASVPGYCEAFTEYNLTGGMDVDLFYLKTVADTYKVSIRNRSLSDQAKLDNGELPNVRTCEKYLTVYTARHPISDQSTDAGNVYNMSEEAVYTVPKNVDMSIYCNGSDNTFKRFFTVRNKSLYSGIVGNLTEYQISYAPYGNIVEVE